PCSTLLLLYRHPSGAVAILPQHLVDRQGFYLYAVLLFTDGVLATAIQSSRVRSREDRARTDCFKVLLPLEAGGSGENTGGTVVIMGQLVDGWRDFAAGSGESARGRG